LLVKVSKDKRSSIFICPYTQFADDTKLGRPANMPEGRAIIQRYVDTLKEFNIQQGQMQSHAAGEE